ncbi:TIGR02678 family protein [Streptomyces sp. 5.8]|uniref:TIGR02678 family protein n=1 Tax=Streptomyces sp. 5.8 TaxID=3406571 RepID=UPI003BB6ADC3
MSRVADGVPALELAEYQKAVRLVLRHPLITAGHPDRAALPLVRRWAQLLRADLGEVLGYRLVTDGETARLFRTQDALDATRPALTKAGRPFDRRRYAYLALTLAALGRSGTQVSLSELASAVAADAGRIDGLGMDTGRKPDRDAFVDAVTWLEACAALRMADGSAADWAGDPDKAEALYDIDREVVGALFRPSRALQHLDSVTGLLHESGSRGLAQGRETQRRAAAREARRMVLEQPVVYYADVDAALHGQLRSPALAEDLARLTGLEVERRAEGVALVDIARRLSDTAFPAGGTVAQAALLLCAKIAGQVEWAATSRGRIEYLPAPDAAERLQRAAERIDGALPARAAAAELLNDAPERPRPERQESEPGEEAAYPFLTEAWLRAALRKLTAEFGAGMAEKQLADPERLLAEALGLLASMGLLARVDGGVLVLPLLARYRGVTAQIRLPRQAGRKTDPEARVEILAATATATATATETETGTETGTATTIETKDDRA